MASASPTRRRRLLILLLVLLVAIVSVSLWQWRDENGAPTAIAGQPARAPVTNRPAASASATPAAPTSTLSTTSAPEPAPAPAHTLRALTFTMDAQGIRLTDAAVLPGRAKAPPRSSAPDRIQFEVTDATGAVAYRGEVDHPLRRWLEHEDEQSPGTLRRVFHTVDNEAFQLRLPAGIPAARIAFTEIRRDAAGEVRAPLGVIALP